MICQVCGRNPAVVHLEEIREGRRRHVWLCVECAGRRSAGRNEADGSDGLDEGERLFGAGGRRSGEDALTSFLGQMFEPGVLPDDEAKACPACGFTLGQLGKTSRLGCPACYETFRATLLPLLTRLHRNSSHMGKAPRRNSAGLTPEGEIARRRIALEKAIAAENFEEAARLRDLIGRLGSAPEGDEGSRS